MHYCIWLLRIRAKRLNANIMYVRWCIMWQQSLFDYSLFSLSVFESLMTHRRRQASECDGNICVSSFSQWEINGPVFNQGTVEYTACRRWWCGRHAGCSTEKNKPPGRNFQNGRRWLRNRKFQIVMQEPFQHPDVEYDGCFIRKAKHYLNTPTHLSSSCSRSPWC